MIAAAAKRIPNFAGVALVDILANGVAVLIIVIVLSIASRFEQEQQYSERIQEVSAVMTREFSTSLVLNRLAAGPPAMLHDYENSELDRIWHPLVLPVLEIHNDFVRDPHSGKIWYRNELLQEPNSLDIHLSDFDAYQRNALRGDFYDVGTFYLLMSILKDHQITINHWHFIGTTGIGQDASLSTCPAGMSAKDCVGSGTNAGSTNMADVFESMVDGNGKNQDEGDWPPANADWGEPGTSGGEHATSLPQGTSMGPSSGGNLDSESFPDARASREGMRGQGGGSSAATADAPGLTIRLAAPNAMPTTIDGLTPAAIRLDPAAFFAAIMVFLDEVQAVYDSGKPPTELLHQFIPTLEALLMELPELSTNQEEAVEDLALALELVHQQPLRASETEPLATTPLAQTANPEALLRIATNRVLIDAEFQSNNIAQLEALPDQARLRFNLQMYPDIWQGLQVSLDRNAVLLVPPDQSEPSKPKWRAVAYIAPQLDDFVVGFVYSTYSEDGLIEVMAEPNQSLANTMRLLPHWTKQSFGIQAWMTLLYMTAGLVLIAMLFFWRPGARFRR